MKTSQSETARKSSAWVFIAATESFTKQTLVLETFRGFQHSLARGVVGWQPCCQIRQTCQAIIISANLPRDGASHPRMRTVRLDWTFF